jgi:hypothetical protein
MVKSEAAKMSSQQLVKEGENKNNEIGYIYYGRGNGCLD